MHPLKPLLSLLLLVPFIGFSQRDKDTVRVVMVLCDTSDFKAPNGPYLSFDEAIREQRKLYGLWWEWGYSVREKHNTAEGVIDAGGNICIGENGQQVDCYADYWQHILYLDEKKKPLPKNIIVWLAK